MQGRVGLCLPHRPSEPLRLAHSKPLIRTVWKEPRGAQRKVSWPELQALETQALGAGEEGKGEAARDKGKGEAGHTTAKDPQDRAGEDPGEHRGGKEKKPKLDYLLDFLCTPELEGVAREKQKMKKIKAHINLRSQSHIF